MLDHHITIHYPNAKKALLTNSKTLLRDVQDLIGTGNIQVQLQLLQLLRYQGIAYLDDFAQQAAK